MTWRNTIVCLLVVCSAAIADTQPVKSDQDILMELERKWDAAFRRNDVKFIETILADEFIVTYDDGTRADKAKELALAASFNQQIDSSSLDEFTIKTYRDTVVVWFTLHLIGPMQGRPVELTYRYIDVWVLRDGRWQCVGSQSTKVTPPKS
jgi:ketosteroid isomerase-like protein